MIAASPVWSYRAKKLSEETSHEPCLSIIDATENSGILSEFLPNYASFLTQHHNSSDMWHWQPSYALTSLSLYSFKCAGYETHLAGCLSQQPDDTMISKL